MKYLTEKTMASKQLTAQNDTLEISLNGLRAAVVALGVQNGGHANARVCLEGQIDSDWFTPITLIKPTADPKEEVAELAEGETGWADLPAYRKARARRTDASGGVCVVEMNVAHGA